MLTQANASLQSTTCSITMKHIVILCVTIVIIDRYAGGTFGNFMSIHTMLMHNSNNIVGAGNVYIARYDAAGKLYTSINFL